MKKIFFPLLIIPFCLMPLYQALGADPKHCECGEHATGITTYSVDGTDCCHDAPLSVGFYYTYTNEGGDVWSVNTTTTITGTAAQSTCCRQNT